MELPVTLASSRQPLDEHRHLKTKIDGSRFIFRPDSAAARLGVTAWLVLKRVTERGSACAGRGGKDFKDSSHFYVISGKQPRCSDVLKWKLDWREIFIYVFINLFQRDFLSGGQPLGLLLQQV